ncbi:MAG TPA: hypothetical protein VD971_08410 [Phycisphaerales bacterium]|nr:hypothetical protein [Phycisphaerales bacterium]
MIFSVIVLLATLLIAYIWSTRGFFSALIHMVCTVIAGAIAFAAWEPVSLAILKGAPTRGALSVFENSAWGLGLVLPFAISLAVLRLAVDQLLKANVAVNQIVNYAGGGLCGLVSATITMGVLVISLGSFRFDSSLMGWQPIDYNNNGSPVRKSGLLLPVDSITAGVYSTLSRQSFSVDEPLARWYPNLQDRGPAMRVNFGDGKSRNTIRPNQFEVLGTFSVGGPGSRLRDLLAEASNPASQDVSDVGGEKFPDNSTLFGVVIKFNAGANEKTGKFAIGAAQIQLLVENADGQTSVVYPVAATSQAEAAAPVFGRWRLDSPGTFVSSVGGASEHFFAFEFVLPPNARPLAVYVKGTRASLQGAREFMKFPNAFMRDAALKALPALITGGAVPGAEIDASRAVQIAPDRNSQTVPGVMVTPSIGFTIQKGQQQGIEIHEESRNQTVIVDGEATFNTADIGQWQSALERTLRIDQYQADTDTSLVQIDATAGTPFSILNPIVQGLDRSAPVMLVDAQGQQYPPVGMTYQDEVKTTVRFMPGQPLMSLAMIDAAGERMSNSRPDQKLRLVFRVSKGAQLKYFAVGGKAIVEFKPPMPVP